MKNQKGFSLKTLIIVVVVIIFLVMISGDNNSGYKLNVSNHEVVAYTTLRYAIAQARYADNLTSSLSKYDFATIGSMVKNANNSYQWFSDASSKEFVFANFATSDQLINLGVPASEVENIEVTYISDGEYCAIFYVKKVGEDYYLYDYNFNADDYVSCLIKLN